MRYTFDETGSVIGFSTHYPNFTNGYWEDYLFAKNLQGDVVAMYFITTEPPKLIATYDLRGGRGRSGLRRLRPGQFSPCPTRHTRKSRLILAVPQIGRAHV